MPILDEMLGFLLFCLAVLLPSAAVTCGIDNRAREAQDEALPHPERGGEALEDGQPAQQAREGNTLLLGTFR